VRIFRGLAGEEEQLMEVNLGYMKKSKKEGWRIEETPEQDLAVIQLRWRPGDRFLAASTSSGLLALLQVTSTTSAMPQIRCAEGTIVDDEFLGLDWACDGSRIVAAGRQKKLNVFDWEMNLVSEHGNSDLSSETTVSGHQARVVALRAHKKDPNVFVTAGMDQMILLWDIRQPTAAGHFTGPNVTGDALDTAGDGSAILTGSQRDSDQVELWDMRALGQRWFTSGPRVTGEDGTVVGTTPVTAGFSKDRGNRFIFSAGASNNSAKVYTTPALPNDGVPAFGDNPPPLGEVAEYRGPPCSFTCLDSSYSGWRAAFGSLDGTVSVIDMKRRN
jgi:WD40 repeat protein